LVQGGGAGQPDAKQPSDKAVEDAAAAQDPAEVAAPKEDVGYIQPTSGQQDVKPSGSDPMGAELDAELERSRAGDRSGLDDAIEIS
jgi:hypothetical protein